MQKEIGLRKKEVRSALNYYRHSNALLLDELRIFE